METKTCISCGAKYGLPLNSKIVWQEHEGLLMLTMSKEKSPNDVSHKANMCAPCSITILSGLLQMEMKEISDVFGSRMREE